MKNIILLTAALLVAPITPLSTPLAAQNRGTVRPAPKMADGKPADGFIPAQRMTVTQAVDAYMSGAAFAGRREKTEGSIEAGKVADVVIVNQNLFEIDPHHIGATKVWITIAGGKVVYEADSN